MIRERTGDPWHDHGIGYALFGLEEKNLFMAANDTEHIVHYRNYGQNLWDELTASLSEYPPFKGLGEEQIFKVQFLRWLLAHGLAFQAATQPPELFDPENITALMREGSEAIITGLKVQFRVPKK